MFNIDMLQSVFQVRWPNAFSFAVKDDLFTYYAPPSNRTLRTEYGVSDIVRRARPLLASVYRTNTGLMFPCAIFALEFAVNSNKTGIKTRLVRWQAHIYDFQGYGE